MKSRDYLIFCVAAVLLWTLLATSVWARGADAGIGTLPGVDWHFPLFLAHGITGVRNMNDATVDVTFGLDKEFERRVAEDELFGPRGHSRRATIPSGGA